MKNGQSQSKNKQINCQKEVLKTLEAAAFLNISKAVLEQDRVHGRLKIPFIRIGRAVRYRRTDLEAYLASLPTFNSTSDADVR